MLGARSIRAVAVAAVVVAFLAAVATAEARNPVLTCNFTGQAWTGTTPIPRLGTFGGTGLFRLESDRTLHDMRCVYSDAQGTVRVDENAAMLSNGWYENLACGSGLFHGIEGAGETTITFSQPGIPNVTQATYTIAAVGGHGTLTVEKLNSRGVSGTGEIDTIPHEPGWAGGDCVTSDVIAFDVVGTFTIVG